MHIYRTLVSSQLLVNQLTDPHWVVVDCRFSLSDVGAGRRHYLAGHIPRAHYAHLDDDLSGPITRTSGRHPLPDPVELSQTLGRWGITPHSQVVAYDDVGGAMAARLWWLLRWLGHEKVAVLDGGWQAWQASGYPVQQTEPVSLATRYPGYPRASAWLASDQVAEQVAERSICLIDARATERFQGWEETIDPVAGHVPGALNRPFQLNLDGKGRFKKPDILRAAFHALIGDRKLDEVVHMCGSGVTACHNLLAMEHAGLLGSRLYAGSWSEWLRDPSRPLINQEKTD